MQTKITHLTSAHPRYDTRIFVKMCSSLATKKEYTLSLVVADGKGDESRSAVDIVDVGVRSGGRISRMTKTVRKVFERAVELDSDIYHLHDPELIPIGLKLKKMGKKVIFDAHEDLPKQILGKAYINKPLRVLLSKAFEIYEKQSCKKFDYIVTATPYIKDKFLLINSNSIDINNFPILDELSNSLSWSDKKDEVCYLGGMATIRGTREIVKAIGMTKTTRLNLAGKFSEKELEREVKSYPEWSQVNELGFLDRHGIYEVLSRSQAGLVTLHPIINYVDALPVKMFEYMAAGVPVISSDIELWRGIIEGNSCGVCVDPFDSKEIAEAIEYIVSHSKEAEEMGENGKKAVIKKYNWGIEEQKLFEVYRKLLEY